MVGVNLLGHLYKTVFADWVRNSVEHLVHHLLIKSHNISFLIVFCIRCTKCTSWLVWRLHRHQQPKTSIVITQNSSGHMPGSKCRSEACPRPALFPLTLDNYHGCAL